MSSHERTRKIINELIKQLASGTHIILENRRPNLYPYLSKDLRESLPSTQAQAISLRIMRYLKNQQLILINDHPKAQVRIRLSPKGVERVQKITLQELSIPRPTRWDRKWRLVFFDIPESKRQKRNQLVLKLKALGFYQVQRSMWLHPYPCHIEIEYLKNVYGLRPYVCLAEIIKIDRANHLMHKFRGLVPQKRMS